MTTRAIWMILLLALPLHSAEKKDTPAREHTVVIRAGQLWDGTSNQLTAHQIIVVHDNRVVKVMFEGAGEAIPQADETIDLSNAIVLPGLIDTHTHLFLQGEDPEEGDYDTQLLKWSLPYRTARATAAARRALEQGFTTIRDVETEGAGYGDIGLKRAVDEGHIPGPRIFATGRAISTTGGYPLGASDGYAPEFVHSLPKGVQIIDGPVEARKAAREQIDAGVDWIKVYMTHRSWVDKRGNLYSQPTLTMEEIQAIIDEAHGQQKKVACHAYGGTGLQRALDAGCDSIEHGLDLDDRAISKMAKQGTWYVPTIAVYYYLLEPENTPAGKRDRKRIEVHGPSFKKALKAGVKIAFGTDVGGFTWKDPIAQEFDRMLEFGMTPIEALRSATVNAAELLDIKGELGVIAPGAYADIIAVSADPFKDIKAVRNVNFVMKDGKIFKNDLKSGN